MSNSILITGAAGGMGKEASLLFARKGFRVFAVDLTLPAPGDSIVPLQADLTDPDQVHALYERVRSETDTLSAILHFAGIYRLNSLVEINPSEFRSVFTVNMGAAFLVNRTFLPMLRSGSKILLLTSELAVRDPLPFTGLYAVSKAALDRYAYSLRMELQLLHISVSVLRAGAVDTGMLGTSTNQLRTFCEKTQLYPVNAKRFQRIVERVQTKRVKPEAVAKKLYGICCSKNPRFAYSINRNPLLILFDWLPSRIRFFLIRLILKPKDTAEQKKEPTQSD